MQFLRRLTARSGVCRGSTSQQWGAGRGNPPPNVSHQQGLPRYAQQQQPVYGSSDYPAMSQQQRFSYSHMGQAPSHMSHPPHMSHAPHMTQHPPQMGHPQYATQYPRGYPQQPSAYMQQMYRPPVGQQGGVMSQQMGQQPQGSSTLAASLSPSLSSRDRPAGSNKTAMRQKARKAKARREGGPQLCLFSPLIGQGLAGLQASPAFLQKHI